MTSPGPDPLDAARLADTVEPWPVTGSERRLRTSILAVRTDQVIMPGGEVTARDVVEHAGAVGIVVLDDQQRILLIRQYRHAVGRLLWELPAGLRDVPGEPVHVTAERELLEETGHRASDWRMLLDYFASPGFTNERIRVFLARGVTEVPHAERDFVPVHEEAYLRLAWVPLTEAVRRVLSGDLHNGLVVVGILSAYAASQDGFAGLRPADAPDG